MHVDANWCSEGTACEQDSAMERLVVDREDPTHWLPGGSKRRPDGAIVANEEYEDSLLDESSLSDVPSFASELSELELDSGDTDSEFGDEDGGRLEDGGGLFSDADWLCGAYCS